MTLSFYVSALAWLSFFGAYWYCFTNDKWSAAGILLIVGSLVIAVAAGLRHLTDRKV